MIAVAEPADELYAHAPASAAATAKWAERCYHLLTVGDLVVGAGRSVREGGRRRSAFAYVATPEEMHVVRAEGAAAPPDEPRTGAVSIAVREPLRRVAIDVDVAPFALGLTFEARTPAVLASANRIRQRGQLVTDYSNFFQSGRYGGRIRLGEREIEVAGRAGFRDRGWGVRKHEGAPRRGLVLFCACELPAVAIHLGLYETAAGERARTFGWLVGEDGDVRRLAAVEHRLEFRGGLLAGGALQLRAADGVTHLLEFSASGARGYLRAAGYAADPAESGPGIESHRLDGCAARRLAGQVDSACRFRLDGATTGHGLVEVGLGEHARYRPPGPGTRPSACRP